MGRTWNPWGALRARAATELWWTAEPSAPAGAAVVDESGERVILHERLGRRERSATLGHELVHLERGLLPPEAPPGIVQREEATVDRIVADRLVPPTLLVELIRRHEDLGEPVTAAVVAEAFEVPDEVAWRALGLLHVRQVRDVLG